VALRIQHSLVNRLEQRLKLSPQILLSLKFLQLPLLDLEQRVSQELAENPFLELKDDSGEGENQIEGPVEAEGPSLEEDGDWSAGDETEAGADSGSAVSLDEMDREFAEYFDRAGELPRRPVPATGSSGKMESIANTAAPGITLVEHLERQLHLLDIDPLTRKAAEVIIENLDKSGFLPYNLPELASAAGDEEITVERLEAALKVVQSLDPPGVGARDMVEALILQLDPENPTQAVARRILANHLPELAKNQLPKIARALGVTIEDVKEAIHYVSLLNRRPGADFVNEEPHYVVPDVIVEEVDGRFEVRLEDGGLPEIRLSRSYQKLLSQAKSDPAVAEALRKKLESAKWVLASIEQRRMTLYNVAVAIVESQEEFMRRGLEAMKPLRMVDVAEKLGVHVSTVGRAIADKYMQTPQGIFPMKYFFSGGTSGNNGEEMSWRTVKQQIADLVQAEDKSNPLSDEEIVQKLRARGIDVARRTVAKYRTALNIPSSRKRKQY